MKLSIVLVLFLTATVAEGKTDINWHIAMRSILNAHINIKKCLNNEFWKIDKKLFTGVNCKMYLISGYGKNTVKMSASSTHSTCSLNRGILYTEEGRHGTGSWCANTNGGGEYLQVELPFMSWITGIATQGRDSARYNDQWVTSYRVQHSIDCKTWKTIGKRNGQVFTGNSDYNTVKTNMFTTPFRAKCIRVEPALYHVYKSLRLEIVGCKI